MNEDFAASPVVDGRQDMSYQQDNSKHDTRCQSFVMGLKLLWAASLIDDQICKLCIAFYAYQTMYSGISTCWGAAYLEGFGTKVHQESYAQVLPNRNSGTELVGHVLENHTNANRDQRHETKRCN